MAPVWFIRENALGKQQISNMEHGSETDRATSTSSGQLAGSGLCEEVAPLLMVSRGHKESGFPTIEPPRCPAISRQRAKETTTMTAARGVTSVC